MADRRVISKEIYTQRKFLQLSPTTQNLYTYLVLFSDIDGVVEAYSVMQMIGASQKDLENLNQEHYITVLNEDWVTYIEDFQSFNNLDGRGMRGSKYRSLLISVKPNARLTELKPKSKKKINHKEVPCDSHGNRMEITCTTEPNLTELNLTDDDEKSSSTSSSLINYAIAKLGRQKITLDLITTIKQLLIEHSEAELYDYVDYMAKLTADHRLGSFKPNVTYIFTTGIEEYWGRFRNIQKSNAFNQFQQNDYDFEEIEKKLLRN